MALLDVRDLDVAFATADGPLAAIERLSFAIEPGAILGLVGESGCGKSAAALALMGLHPPRTKIGGSARFLGRDLLALTEPERRAIRGKEIAMIFQDPLSAMNPAMKVGEQIGECLEIHGLADGSRAGVRAIELLERVGIAEPERRARAYPHQLSGGMRQRAMIAAALAGKPKLLIADEPTTALDVTVQAQIVDLLLELRERENLAILFISHDLALVSEVADDVLVMYAGRAVERAPAADLFRAPLHPYSQGLLATLPKLDRSGAKANLPTLAGRVPDPRHRPAGCRFVDRCPIATCACHGAEPELSGAPHGVACFNARW